MTIETNKQLFDKVLQKHFPTETNTERLERAKDYLQNTFIALARKNGKTQMCEDLTYLIQQAEHAEKLCKLYNEQGTALSNRSNEIHLLKLENARLLDALEFYADEENYNVNTTNQWEPLILINQDHGELARQALKGESE
ncbi:MULTISPECIES: hypothetical protein [unclassified Sporosarcina]|uniref:hypothetical protein n=1 Tax=unclassified Sporosarcina TaxID=2647733 RepID=UPI00203CA210|nr:MULTISPECIES: hypothetical protein [unclassified Sporosarcina]GKV65484.1 hypothetical protein NCCP2331_16370 [Sporosarcina sp. NCCP-2331]GLB55608.1 hypothetical protein NCCP2378_13950 [Sporosarcina sp. NCCP-2378]